MVLEGCPCLAFNGCMNAHETFESPPPLKPSEKERQWAMAAHLIPTLAAVASGGVLGFVLVVIIYLLKKDESAFVAHAARESLNFQFTAFLACILCLVLIFTVAFVSCAQEAGPKDRSENEIAAAAASFGKTMRACSTRVLACDMRNSSMR